MPESEEIVRRHGPMVWKTVYRLVGGSGREAEAADCFQEVFVAALEIGRREKVRNWEALLRRIATTKGLDMLRATIRQRRRSVPGVMWDDLPGRTERPDTRLEQDERARDLREALVRLRPEEADLFCMRHIEEMSYEEIAGQMGMTPNAVGAALHRIKETLRELLAGKNIARQGEVRHE